MSASPITEIDLHAYADGQLETSRRAEVEAFLAAHPEIVAEVQAWRTQNQSLHDIYDGVLNEPVPLRLTGSVRTRRWPRGIAAGVAWLSCGLAAGWLAHGWMQTPAQPRTFAQNALAAHVLYATEQRHPVEVSVQQEEHLVAWLSKRLSAPIRAPKLQEQGFGLLGGRLLPGQDGPLAQLMYESDQGERLTLTVRHASHAQPETGFKVMEQGGNRAFYWIDRDYGYALSGSIDKGKLLEIAQAVYLQLHQPPN